jgi:hypothetical protein
MAGRRAWLERRGSERPRILRRGHCPTRSAHRGRGECQENPPSPGQSPHGIRPGRPGEEPGLGRRLLLLGLSLKLVFECKPVVEIANLCGHPLLIFLEGLFHQVQAHTVVTEQSLNLLDPLTSYRLVGVVEEMGKDVLVVLQPHHRGLREQGEPIGQHGQLGGVVGNDSLRGMGAPRSKFL